MAGIDAIEISIKFSGTAPAADKTARDAIAVATSSRSMSAGQIRTALEAVYGQSTPIPPFNFGIQDQDTRVLVSDDWDVEIHSTSIGGCIEAAFRLENELTKIFGQTLEFKLLGPYPLLSGARGSGLIRQQNKLLRNRAIRALSGKFALSGTSAVIGAIIGAVIRSLLG
ncbi:MAG: hypothetical protein IH867_09285 [Chloroflexi bacterium]|nr:hypothetical protein [Chloroflexota bacterium]